MFLFVVFLPLRLGTLFPCLLLGSLFSVSLVSSTSDFGVMSYLGLSVRIVKVFLL